MQSARKGGITTAGKRKLCDEDMILLCWLRHATHPISRPWRRSLEFPRPTARNYFKEVRAAFKKDVLDLLFLLPRPRRKWCLGLQMISQSRSPRFASLWMEFRFGQRLPQNFALNRLAWSSYKHYPCFLLVGGEWISFALDVCVR